MNTVLTRRVGKRTDPRRRLDARTRRTDLRRARRTYERGEIPVAFWVLVTVVGALCVLGLIMVLSVTTVRGYYRLDSAAYFFKRQAFFLVLGAIALFTTYKVGYRRISRLATPAMFLSGVLLSLVLVLGNEVNGSTRWFALGWLNFQPSELAKIVSVVWVAKLLASREREMHDGTRTIVPVLCVMGVTAGLIYLEPDLGTIIVMGIVTATMLVVAGARLDWMAAIGLPLTGAVFLISQTGYHANRWGFLNPLENADSTNYQLLGSLSSVASGGWFGVGPGSSNAKWGFLPEAHTDAIFAVVAEEMGIFGALAVIAMYIVIVVCGIHVARYAAERFGQLLAIGITTLISVQALINIGVVLGALPNKGFTLPFVSYGGSSMVICLAGVGLLLSVAREGDEAQARQRRRKSTDLRRASGAPARGGLVLVASDGRATRRSVPSAATLRDAAAERLRGTGRSVPMAGSSSRRAASGSRTASGRPATGRTASGRTAAKRTSTGPRSTTQRTTTQRTAGSRSASGRATQSRSSAGRSTAGRSGAQARSRSTKQTAADRASREPASGRSRSTAGARRPADGRGSQRAVNR